MLIKYHLYNSIAIINDFKFDLIFTCLVLMCFSHFYYVWSFLDVIMLY